MLAALPGLLLAILLITTFPDPRQAGRASKEQAGGDYDTLCLQMNWNLMVHSKQK